VSSPENLGPRPPEVLVHDHYGGETRAQLLVRLDPAPFQMVLDKGDGRARDAARHRGRNRTARDLRRDSQRASPEAEINAEFFGAQRNANLMLQEGAAPWCPATKLDEIAEPGAGGPRTA